MSNKYRGESSLEIEGRPYTLVFDLDAMEAIEEHFNQDWGEIQPRLTKGSIRVSRVMLWAMFRSHHPEVTFDESKRLIDAAGGIRAMGSIIETAMRNASPDEADLKELGVGKERPPSAQPIRKSRHDQQSGVGSISMPASVA